MLRQPANDHYIFRLIAEGNTTEVMRYLYNGGQTGYVTLEYIEKFRSAFRKAVDSGNVKQLAWIMLVHPIHLPDLVDCYLVSLTKTSSNVQFFLREVINLFEPACSNFLNALKGEAYKYLYPACVKFIGDDGRLSIHDRQCMSKEDAENYSFFLNVASHNFYKLPGEKKYTVPADLQKIIEPKLKESETVSAEYQRPLRRPVMGLFSEPEAQHLETISETRELLSTVAQHFKTSEEDIQKNNIVENTLLSFVRNNLSSDQQQNLPEKCSDQCFWQVQQGRADAEYVVITYKHLDAVFPSDIYVFEQKLRALFNLDAQTVYLSKDKDIEFEIFIEKSCFIKKILPVLAVFQGAPSFSPVASSDLSPIGIGGGLRC